MLGLLSAILMAVAFRHLAAKSSFYFYFAIIFILFLFCCFLSLWLLPFRCLGCRAVLRFSPPFLILAAVFIPMPFSSLPSILSCFSQTAIIIIAIHFITFQPDSNYHHCHPFYHVSARQQLSSLPSILSRFSQTAIIIVAIHFIMFQPDSNYHHCHPFYHVSARQQLSSLPSILSCFSQTAIIIIAIHFIMFQPDSNYHTAFHSRLHLSFVELPFALVLSSPC